jgi:hypothetical protein
MCWNRSVISQARAHDVSDVFDTGYTPETEEEKQLFKAKQEFVLTSQTGKVVGLRLD